MKISQYVLYSFLFILLLFSLTTYNDYRLSKEVKENAAYSTTSKEITRLGGKYQRGILVMANGVRSYLLTGENTFLQSYHAASAENDSIMKKLSVLLAGSSRSSMLADIQSLGSQWAAELESLSRRTDERLQGSGNSEAVKKKYVSEFQEGHVRLAEDNLLEKMNTLVNSEYDTREQKKLVLNQSVNNIITVSYTLTIISIIVAIVVVIWLMRIISRRISQMTKLANAIANGNYDVKVGDIGNDELSALGISLNTMAQKLSTSINLLKRTNAELDQFAHIVSHDMKAPLRGISNVVNWIEEDHNTELTPQLKEYIELIKIRTRRAENLIQGLLSYARINKDEMHTEEVRLDDLIKEILENVPDKKNVKAVVDELPVVCTERLLLLQVFTNLVDNAIKYNDKPEITIHIYYRDRGDRYEFFVEDNGIGIAPAHHMRIYDLFQTLVVDDTFGSTGVGLSIVKKILDSKQQTINLSSDAGKGSIFSFTWPKN